MRTTRSTSRIHDPPGRRRLDRGRRADRFGDLPHAQEGPEDRGHNTNVGDEGGFAPNLGSATEALDFIMSSIEKAGYKPGEDIFLGLDCASTEFFKDGQYNYEGEGVVRSIEEQVDYLAKLAADYPIISIEDGMAETTGRAGSC